MTKTKLPFFYKRMSFWIFGVPLIAMLWGVGLFAFTYIYELINKDVFHNIAGKFYGLHYTKASKRRSAESYLIVRPTNSEEKVLYSTYLLKGEEIFLSSYQGPIEITYNKTLFDDVRVHQIKTDWGRSQREWAIPQASSDLYVCVNSYHLIINSTTNKNKRSCQKLGLTHLLSK